MTAKDLSEDYATYIIKSNVFEEIKPILSTTENIQSRINEIDHVFLPTIRHDTEVSHQNISQILEFQPKFDKICDQIDSLESIIERIKSDLNNLHRQVDIAEEELDIPERKIDIILKSINIFAKSNFTREARETNWSDDGFYLTPKIFNANDFFKPKE